MPGKCILAGEHSVIRGKPALVAQLWSRKLSLTATASSEWKYTGAPALKQALEEALLLTQVNPPTPYHLELESEIPLQSGLGSSAALAVALCLFLRQFKDFEIFPFAKDIENIFHGQSSGIDIAGVMHEAPILFSKGVAPSIVSGASLKGLYLFDTGLRSSTKECVEKVSALGRTDLDDQMEEAVKLCLLGIQGEVASLVRGFEKAASVFREWGLVPSSMEEQMKMLRMSGALAVKPTGSGMGGFLLSFWQEKPPVSLGLIPLG